jgi:hypothetical protein
VVSLGTTGGAVIGCSPDMAQRANGFNRMLRIYSKGATVKLSVPQSIAGAVFDSWDIIGGDIDKKGVKTTEVEFQLNDHVLAQCHWNRSQPQVRPLAFTPVLDFKKLAEVAPGQKDEKVLQKLRAVIAAPPPAQDLVMRVEPSPTAVVVGLLPLLDDAELVEEGQDGWKLVNYRGTVGWVKV